MVSTSVKDGWSADITGIESNAGIKGAVFSALSSAGLNLRKDKNYTLLIYSDGRGNIRLTTDAPKDVIEPELAKIRQATARGDEYYGNVSGLTPAKLNAYTLNGLADGNIKASVRSALWVMDMRTGGKNQQFSGVSAGIDGAGIARAVVRADDATNNTYLSNTFSDAEARQQKASALSAYAEELLAERKADRQRRFAERIPGTPEFQAKLDRDLEASSAADAEKLAWAKRNKKDPYAKQILAGARRRRTRPVRKAMGEIKRAGSRSSALARHTMRTLVHTILATVAAGVAISAKTLSALLGVGETVRQRNVNDIKLNLAPGTNRNWVKFARNNGFDEEALTRALGGLYGSFGNIRNFTGTNLEPWVFLLGKNITETMSMFSGGGDGNTVRMMNAVMDALLRNAQSRIIDITKSGGSITEQQAISEQIQMLSPLNQGLSTLYTAFLEQLEKYKKLNPGSGIGEFGGHLTRLAAQAGYSVSGVWDAFMNSGLFHPGEGGGTEQADRGIFDTATVQALDNLRGALSSFRLVKEDVFAAISHNVVNLVNYVRSILNDFIRPFFPAFAQREDERAAYVNTQSREIVNRHIGGDKQAAELLLKMLIPDDKVQPVLDALASFKETKDVRPLFNLGLSDAQLSGIFEPGNFAVVNAYLRDVEALKTLDDLAGKGNKRAYTVTDELSAETLKWNTGWTLSLLDAALGMYRKKDVGYVGTLNEAYSNSELAVKQQRELRRLLSGGNAPTSAELAMDTSRSDEVDAAGAWLKKNRDRVEADASGIFSATQSTYSPTLLRKDTLTEFTNILDLYEKAKKDPRLWYSGFQEDGRLKGLGEEAFNILLREARVIAGSQLLASGNMPGADQKKFFNSMRAIYQNIRGTEPERADQILTEVLLPFLHSASTGEAANEATRQAFKRARVDLPELLPDIVEMFLEDTINAESAQTILEKLAENARLKALASGISARADMAPLDFAVFKQDLARKIEARFGETIYSLAGNTADRKSVRLQSDEKKAGNLTVIYRVDGKDVSHAVFPGLLDPGISIDKIIETGDQYLNWQRSYSPQK
jgi:hypothetical protein